MHHFILIVIIVFQTNNTSISCQWMTKYGITTCMNQYFFTIIMSTFFLESLKNKYNPHHSYINNITLKEIKFLVCLKLSDIHNLNIL